MHMHMHMCPEGRSAALFGKARDTHYQSHALELVAHDEKRLASALSGERQYAMRADPPAHGEASRVRVVKH